MSKWEPVRVDIPGFVTDNDLRQVIQGMFDALGLVLEYRYMPDIGDYEFRVTKVPD